MWQYRICCVFFFFFWLWGTWYLNSLVRDQTCIPHIKSTLFNRQDRASYFHDDAMRQCIVLKGIPHSCPSWTCECEIISQIESCKCNQLKMNPISTSTSSQEEEFLNRYKRGRRPYEVGDKSRVMYLQAKNAKDCWKPPEARKEKIPPLVPSERASSCCYLNFSKLLASGIVVEKISVVLRELVCDTWLQQL